MLPGAPRKTKAGSKTRGGKECALLSGRCRCCPICLKAHVDRAVGVSFRGFQEGCPLIG